MKSNASRFLLPLSALALWAGASGCNVFSPLDSPTSDPQLLSAARAAFDRGDFSTAMADYKKLAANRPDTANIEQAYAVLDQNGAGFGTFASTFGSGANGASITKLAEALAPASNSGGNAIPAAGPAKRHSLYLAYTQSKAVTDPSLNALGRFLSAAALASEMLAEAADADGVLRKADISSGAAACSFKTGCGGCANPNPNKLPSGGVDITTTEPTETNPGLDSVFTSIKESLGALQTLGAGGSFSSTSDVFSSLLGGLSAPPGGLGAACFRGTLIDQGIGE